MDSKSVVIGIDIGAESSFVAYVGKGVVDIVQNEVSKRSSSALVGFTDRERLLGDAALAKIKSNAKSTCRNFKHLLGQKVDAPMVDKEKFWSTCPLTEAGDGMAGYDVTYKGKGRTFSAPQVTAMFLTKLKEVTEQWCQAKVADVVIGVPAYYSDIHRQAVLDAAKIAGLSVLRLMNEHTATALSYGFYQSDEFDKTKPCNVVFCSMGHSMFSVSIVQFIRGKLNVLSEASDKVGGRDMDECLMRVFAEQFKKKVGCDPLSNKKASFKLEDSVTKTKKILSANAEAGVNVECLMEDEDFSSNMNRDDFEGMCKPMMDKVQAVLDKAKAGANIKVEDIDFVEMVGGASRVPWVKKFCTEAFGGKDLSYTMNADESVSRGCALQAAMLSPLYKVRDFKVEDTTPHAISVGWIGSSADAEAMIEDADADTNTGCAEGEHKTAVLFPVGSVMGTSKMLTFFKKGPFEITAQYADGSALIPGTPCELGTYTIELPASADAKKVNVTAKLTLHGTFTIEGATMEEEEEYEETVKEKREQISDTVAAEAPAENAKTEAPADAAAEGENKEEKKEEKDEKKYEWMEFKKMKRTKKTELKISAKGTPGLSEADAAARQSEESAMQAEMREIIESDAARNDLETYIYDMRDKCSPSRQYGAFMSDADRDKFMDQLTKSEDWLYHTFDGTKAQYADQLNALKAVGDLVVWRCTEDGVRADWIKAVEGTITNYRTVAETPGDRYGHIKPEKMGNIVAICNEMQKWLADMVAKQQGLSKTEWPVLLCADMEKKIHELAGMADGILKQPRPTPPKEEKKEEAKPEEDKKDEKPAGEGKATARTIRGRGSVKFHRRDHSDEEVRGKTSSRGDDNESHDPWSHQPWYMKNRYQDHRDGAWQNDKYMALYGGGDTIGDTIETDPYKNFKSRRNRQQGGGNNWNWSRAHWRSSATRW